MQVEFVETAYFMAFYFSGKRWTTIGQSIVDPVETFPTLWTGGRRIREGINPGARGPEMRRFVTLFGFPGRRVFIYNEPLDNLLFSRVNFADSRQSMSQVGLNFPEKLADFGSSKHVKNRSAGWRTFLSQVMERGVQTDDVGGISGLGTKAVGDQAIEVDGLKSMIRMALVSG